MIVLGQWVVLSITGGILMLLILYNIILKSKNKYGEEKEGTNEEV
jgi:hypothetical protein